MTYVEVYQFSVSMCSASVSKGICSSSPEGVCRTSLIFVSGVITGTACRIPIRNVYSSQFITVGEHCLKGSGVIGLEAADVHCGEFATALEHITEVIYHTGIKLADVQREQRAVIIEHCRHGCDLAGVQESSTTTGNKTVQCGHLTEVRKSTIRIRVCVDFTVAVTGKGQFVSAFPRTVGFQIGCDCTGNRRIRCIPLLYNGLPCCFACSSGTYPSISAAYSVTTSLG